MIKITIEKTTEKVWTTRENVVTKETPTEQREDNNYGHGTKPVMAREFSVQEVSRRDSTRVNLLEQVIENDADFDLAAVIVAINKLDQRDVKSPPYQTPAPAKTLTRG